MCFFLSDLVVSFLSKAHVLKGKRWPINRGNVNIWVLLSSVLTRLFRCFKCQLQFLNNKDCKIMPVKCFYM